MSNDALAKHKAGVEKFMAQVASRKQTFQALLPRGMDADWYVGEVKVCLARTPKLTECDAVSVFDALTTCAQLGLSPSGRLGSAYLIPYAQKCTLVIGYKGYLDLAYRSGEVVGFGAQVVHENEVFEVSEGFDIEIRRHDRDVDAPGALRAVYAWATLRGGFTVKVLMWRREVEAIKARSKASGTGPWKTDEAEMWKKTAIRRLIKLLPLSPQKAQGLARAQEVEDAQFEDIPMATEDADDTTQKRGTARLKALAQGGLRTELEGTSEAMTVQREPGDDYVPEEPPLDVELPSARK